LIKVFDNETTALKQFAVELESLIVANGNPFGIDELNNLQNGKIVYLVRESLKDDIDTLLSMSKKEKTNIFPKVFIARSISSEPSPYQRAFGTHMAFHTLEIVNENDADDKINLSGKMVEYAIRVSIVTVTKSSEANKILSRKIVDILNSNKKYDYSLQAFNDSNELWVLKDFGKIKLLDTEEMQVNELRDDGVVVSVMEFRMMLEFIELADYNINLLKNYVVTGSLLP